MCTKYFCFPTLILSNFSINYIYLLFNTFISDLKSVSKKLHSALMSMLRLGRLKAISCPVLVRHIKQLLPGINQRNYSTFTERLSEPWFQTNFCTQYVALFKNQYIIYNIYYIILYYIYNIYCIIIII